MDVLSTRLIWTLNLVSTWFMVGLIWFVQIVHYPLHGYVPEDIYRDYQQRHMTCTTGVIALPMPIEALTAAHLAYSPPDFGTPELWWFGFVLVLVNLVSTFVLHRPAHEQLLEGFDRETQQFLVRSNWIRTVAWSLRGGLWIYLLIDLSRMT